MVLGYTQWRACQKMLCRRHAPVRHVQSQESVTLRYSEGSLQAERRCFGVPQHDRLADPGKAPGLCTRRASSSLCLGGEWAYTQKTISRKPQSGSCPFIPAGEVKCHATII